MAANARAMKPSSASALPRSGTPLAWAPLLLLALTVVVLWFVTTIVVLLPLVVPSFSITPEPPLDRKATKLELACGVALLVVYQLLFAAFVVSVGRTVLTAPGHIPAWLSSDGKSDLHSYSNLLQAVERKKDGSPRFCRKTAAYKPDRAHYCHEVRACVLQYQDFSRVLNSAVGFYNYKFYLLSLLYGLLSSSFVIAVTLPQVIAAWPHLGASRLDAEAAGQSPLSLAGMRSRVEWLLADDAAAVDVSDREPTTPRTQNISRAHTL